ncbi:MAG: phosphocholine cytidylyltransferase family protein [Actinomycetota bacterium]
MRVFKIGLVRRRRSTSTTPSAVILAAGRGSRLGALTDSAPKCLAVVGGSTLIDHQLDALAAAGVDDITVVTGYRSAAVRRVVGPRARYVHNPDWSMTNSLYSLRLACHQGATWIGDDVIVLNCDVLFHPDALNRVIDAGPNRFAVDRHGGLGAEEMHVVLDGQRLVEMSKKIPISRVDGENVGMVRLSQKTLAAVLHAADELVAAGDRTAWMASAIDRVAADHPLHAVDISDLPWVEIDYPDDLDRAVQHVWPAIAVQTAPIDVVVGPRCEVTA